MSKYVDAIKIKQDRGQVLINLNLFYPDKVFLKTLWRTVLNNPNYSLSLFQRDICYLQQKGYIQLSRNPLRPEGEWEDQLCILTAEGKEVAEGTRTDPAIEL
jgi:hypothetical protein